MGTNVWERHFYFLSWNPLVWMSTFLHTCTEHSSFLHSPSSFFPSNGSGKEVYLQGQHVWQKLYDKTQSTWSDRTRSYSRPKIPPLLTFIGFHLIFQLYLPMDWDSLSSPPPQCKFSVHLSDTSVSDHCCTFLPHVCGLSFLLTSVVISLPSES